MAAGLRRDFLHLLPRIPTRGGFQGLDAGQMTAAPVFQLVCPSLQIFIICKYFLLMVFDKTEVTPPVPAAHRYAVASSKSFLGLKLQPQLPVRPYLERSRYDSCSYRGRA
jgi:hypothetical protein